jgi:hypothetical protein
MCKILLSVGYKELILNPVFVYMNPRFQSHKSYLKFPALVHNRFLGLAKVAQNNRITKGNGLLPGLPGLLGTCESW